MMERTSSVSGGDEGRPPAPQSASQVGAGTGGDGGRVEEGS